MLTIDYDLLGVKEGEGILDVGCGEGRHSYEAYKRNCRVYALDTDEAGLSKTNGLLCLLEDEGLSLGGWAALKGNATSLPFDDSCFDKVICSEVLEHLPHDGQAVAELHRVLKDGGRLAVSVPTFFSETIYWRLSEDYHHQPGDT